MVSRPSFALLPACVAFFAIYPSAAYAKQEIAESLAAYGYRGITMGSSSAEVRSACPNAVFDATHHGTNLGIQTYEVWDDEHYDCVLLRLVDDAVIEIDFIYFPNKVSQQGGLEAIESRTVEAFGSPTTTTPGTRLWDFPASDRMVVAFIVNGKWSTHLYHRSRRLAMAEYKDTTVVRRLIVKNSPAVPSENRNAQATKLAENPGAAWQYTSAQQTQGSSPNGLIAYQRPSDIPVKVFNRLTRSVSLSHPGNEAWQISQLKRQLNAYRSLRSFALPEGMAKSHLYALRKSANRRFPFNYSTQLYVLREDIKRYLNYRDSGVSGDAIMRHLNR